MRGCGRLSRGRLSVIRDGPEIPDRRCNTVTAPRGVTHPTQFTCRGPPSIAGSPRQIGSHGSTRRNRCPRWRRFTVLGCQVPRHRVRPRRRGNSLGIRNNSAGCQRDGAAPGAASRRTQRPGRVAVAPRHAAPGSGCHWQVDMVPGGSGGKAARARVSAAGSVRAGAKAIQPRGPPQAWSGRGRVAQSPSCRQAAAPTRRSTSRQGASVEPRGCGRPVEAWGFAKTPAENVRVKAAISPAQALRRAWWRSMRPCWHRSRGPAIGGCARTRS